MDLLPGAAATLHVDMAAEATPEPKTLEPVMPSHKRRVSVQLSLSGRSKTEGSLSRRPSLLQARSPLLNPFTSINGQLRGAPVQGLERDLFSDGDQHQLPSESRDPIRFTPLARISDQLYSQEMRENFGAPTVMAVSCKSSMYV
jgi:hypothetical protein